MLAARIIIMSALLTTTASAGWTGFPLSSQTETTGWERVESEYSPITQIYSAIVERCNLVGTNNVPLPAVVQSWTLYAGTNITTTNIAGTVYTNLNFISTNIITTNALSPFVYTFTDISGSHSATGYPYVTHDLMYELDAKIETLIGYFVSTNEHTGGSFDAYFAKWPAGPFGAARDLPYESKAGLFDRESIGYVTNRITNMVGFVTNGIAEWTRCAPTTNWYLLAESHYTGDWSFVDVQTFRTNYFETNYFPAAKYIPATTAAYSGSLTITGTVFNPVDQTSWATYETVTPTTNGTPLTNYWKDVSGIFGEATAATGDVVSITWTNEISIFGELAFQLDAYTLDERYRALNGLQWTGSRSDARSFSGTYAWRTNGITFTNVSYNAALAALETNLDNPSSWHSGEYPFATRTYQIQIGPISGQYYASAAEGAFNVKPYWAITNLYTVVTHETKMYDYAQDLSGNYADFQETHPVAFRYALVHAFTTPTTASSNIVPITWWKNPASTLTNRTASVYEQTFNRSSTVVNWLIKWNSLEYAE